MPDQAERLRQLVAARRSAATLMATAAVEGTARMKVESRGFFGLFRWYGSSRLSRLSDTSLGWSSLDGERGRARRVDR